jgi:hypothetical protein
MTADNIDGADDPNPRVLPFSFGGVFRPDTFDIDATPRPPVSSRSPIEPTIESTVHKTYPIGHGATISGSDGRWHGRVIDTTWTKGLSQDDAVIAVTVRRRAVTSIPIPDRNVIVLREGNQIPRDWKKLADSTRTIKVANMETETVHAALDGFANS